MNASTGGIVIEALTHRYGDVVALDTVSLSIAPGQIVGLLGPNGAGKSTLMKLLTCFIAPTQGQVRVAGFDVRREAAKVRERIGYLPENVPLYDEMLTLDYLRFMARLRGVKRAEIDPRLQDVVRITGLSEVLGKAIGELSKGYRQRVGLAQAIVHRPEVLVLDEPTTGLDPNQILELRDLIRQIGQQKTVLFSTHLMQEVAAVCDRVVILNRGRVVFDATRQELLERAQGEPERIAAELEAIFSYHTRAAPIIFAQETPDDDDAPTEEE